MWREECCTCSSLVMTVKKTLLRPNPFCEFEERFQNFNPQIENKRSTEQQRERDLWFVFFLIKF